MKLKMLTFAMLSMTLFAQANTIQPLTQKVNVNPQPVSSDQNLPQILWGADMNVLYANGLEAKTVNGSIYAKEGLSFNLQVKNSVVQQAEDYISGKTPFFRGTLDQVALLNDLVYSKPELRPVVIQQLSWSKGGDSLVVKSSIQNVSDLKGKTVAIMSYGPHMYFLHRVLQSAGLTINDIKIRWVQNLDGENSPFSEFYKDVDAAFMITPDALAATEGENSISGASVIFSTKQADKFVADVYAVRSDYYEANKEKLEKFVRSTFVAYEEIGQLHKDQVSRKAEMKKWLVSSSQHLMNSADLVEDMTALYSEANHTGFAENLSFFTNKREARNFENVSKEINKALNDLKLISSNHPIAVAEWDWNVLRQGLKHADKVEVPRFNKQKVAQKITEMQMQGSLDGEQFLSQQLYFDVGSSNFVYNPSLHQAIFDKIIDEATAYSGSLIIVEGHSDPAHYLIEKYKKQSPEKALKRIRQMARDLSRERAEEVRKAIIEYARDIRNVDVNETQFEVVGYGIDKPETGVCSGEPCKLDLKGKAAVDAYAKNRRAKIGFTRISAEVEVSADDFNF